MLLSLTRVGATRQGLGKGVAVLGTDSGQLERAVDRVLGASRERIEAVAGIPGLRVIRLQHVWLGTLPARNQAFAEMARAAGGLAEAARLAGGIVVPTAVGFRGQPAVLGGDTHVIEVLSSVEQEVLANLLRTHVPTLIAMTGRGVSVAGTSRDRVGSRWLSASRTHLAARYLASTSPQHLERVKAELRRRDGIARLDRLDVVPGFTEDQSPVVVVRCIDAAASLAGGRAHALVLAALALRARRLVRDGRRVGNPSQKTLEDNRARAIADGRRARFVVDQEPGRNRDSAAATTRVVSAREAIRSLLMDLCTEFANLDAMPEELAPVILPAELPRLGLRRVAAEDDLLARWSTQGESVFAQAAADAFCDPAMGGALLRSSLKAAPGRVSIVLEQWRSWIADPGLVKRRGGPPRDQGRPAGRGDHGRGDQPRREPGRRDQSRGGQAHRGQGRRDDQRGRGGRDDQAARDGRQQRGGS